MSSKILFYGVSSHLGGAERSLLDFLIYYKRSNLPQPFSVLLPKRKGPLIEELEKCHIPYEILRFPYFWLKLSRQSLKSQVLFLTLGLPGYLLYLLKLYFHIKNQNISVIHTTGIKCHITMCLLSPFIKSQVVIHFRDLMHSRSLQKIFLKFKDCPKIRWITASAAISKTFPQLPTEVVYCGFSETYYSPQKNHYLHDLLQVPHDHKLIGLVGVFTRWKGQREYILAANLALKELTNCHFLLIGGQIYDTSAEKGYTQNLKKLVSALGRDKQIHFVPFQKDPPKVYNSLDLIVHCSIEPEPFGRVIVEGLFCEVPMIASAAGGAPEIIKDESYGLLHTPGDYEHLARQMIKSLKDPDRQNKAILAARKARQDYSLDGRFKLLKDLLESYK